MAPVITDEREVHVYAHPEEGSDGLAEESKEVMLQIDLPVVLQSIVMWLFHCGRHSSMFLCIMSSTLQQPHRGVFVLSVLVSLL